MSAVKKSSVVEHLRRIQMTELLSKGKRLDGRGLLDYRSIKIEVNPIAKAEGSAKVSVGNTQVIAGVKVEVGEPFPDTPDQGLLVVNAEVLPLSSAYAEPGPPDEDAIELARVVDRGIRASGMIDLSRLVIISGKKVYAIFADVSVLDVDGNLFDATSYAVVTAIAVTKMPKYEVVNGEVVASGEHIPLPVRAMPVSVTMARIGDVIVVDPISEEEAVMDARITFTTDGEGRFCAGQKGYPGTLTFEQIKIASETALLKEKDVSVIVKEAVKRG